MVVQAIWRCTGLRNGQIVPIPGRTTEVVGDGAADELDTAAVADAVAVTASVVDAAVTNTAVPAAVEQEQLLLRVPLVLLLQVLLVRVVLFLMQLLTVSAGTLATLPHAP